MSKRINGEGSIFKRKDGRWCAAYYDKSEQPKRHFVYGKSQKEVSEKLKQIMLDCEIRSGKEYLLKDWILEYLTLYKKNELKESTYGTYMMLYRKHLENSDLGKTYLTRLKAADLQRFYNAKVDAGYSSKTIRHMEVIINSALKQAQKEKVIMENPNEFTTLPKRKAYKAEVLTADEVKLLVEKSKHEEIYPIVITAIFTGMRKGEIMGLTWKDSIDFENGRIHVMQSMCRVMQEPDENGVTRATYQLLEPKNATSNRFIPMTDVVREALIMQKKWQEKQRELYGELYEENDLVFTKPNGHHISPRDIMDKFHAYLQKYGVTDCRFHDLRHCFASLLLTTGVGMKVTSELLGHSTISTSMNIYAHVYDETKSKALNVLDAMVGSSEKKEEE